MLQAHRMGYLCWASNVTWSISNLAWLEFKTRIVGLEMGHSSLPRRRFIIIKGRLYGLQVLINVQLYCNTWALMDWVAIISIFYRHVIEIVMKMNLTLERQLNYLLMGKKSNLITCPWTSLQYPVSKPDTTRLMFEEC